MPVLPTVPVPASEPDEQPVFFYDLGDPGCYLAAEQIISSLPVVPEWEPVLAAQLQPELLSGADRDEIVRRARQLALQPVRWPESWPPDTRPAMLAATYAKRIGRVVAFSLAAFRQAFAAGRDLGDRETILIAGAACEMHPSAILKAISTRAVSDALAQATHRARHAGVSALPAVQIADRLFTGEAALAEAAKVLR
ncbi:MAG TPA: DsbA family protein [Solirubrobacteraceae bacterium]|nr:DsbA family protein [Solirubrobacteraceae bacterium]